MANFFVKFWIWFFALGVSWGASHGFCQNHKIFAFATILLKKWQHRISENLPKYPLSLLLNIFPLYTTIFFKNILLWNSSFMFSQNIINQTINITEFFQSSPFQNNIFPSSLKQLFLGKLVPPLFMEEFGEGLSYIKRSTNKSGSSG